MVIILILFLCSLPLILNLIAKYLPDGPTACDVGACSLKSSSKYYDYCVGSNLIFNPKTLRKNREYSKECTKIVETNLPTPHPRCGPCTIDLMDKIRVERNEVLSGVKGRIDRE